MRGLPVPERTPHLVWRIVVTGSGFREMLAGLSPGQGERVRSRMVARLDGATLAATSFVGVGTGTGTRRA